jgi:hypothetical protein
VCHVSARKSNRDAGFPPSLVGRGWGRGLQPSVHIHYSELKVENRKSKMTFSLIQNKIHHILLYFLQ